MDTIFALASARGRAGVAVIRVSGPLAFYAGERLCGSLPDSHEARLRSVRNAKDELIDQALVLKFEHGRSFTGEDVLELHVHGSPAVVSSILGELAEVDGLRLAEPGEFTRRALENGRLDLTQVEGLSDLLEAETEAQRRQALKVFSGAMAERVASWRTGLVRASSLLAAAIDFADEDIPDEVTAEALMNIRQVKDEIQAELKHSHAAEVIREGFEVAIVGKPNVGKSTLLNEMAGREAAITSDLAGTTRDIIEVRMDFQGFPVTLLDTAGLRETDDVVEGLGIDLAISRAQAADLRVFLVEHSEERPDFFKADDLILVGKDDLGVNGGISGKTGFGIDKLIDEIVDRLMRLTANTGLMTRERHRQAMKKASSALSLACAELDQDRSFLEIPAENIREAVLALDILIGRVDVEDLLGEVFSSFCVGK